MADPTWPTIKEVADRIGVSRQYILRLVSSGRIHGVIRGDVWLIEPASLHQYEATRDRKPGRKKKQPA